jgi:hypothetical protein
MINLRIRPEKKASGVAMPERMKWRPQDTALIYVVMAQKHTQSFKTLGSNLINCSSAHCAEKMERAMERVELEE